MKKFLCMLFCIVLLLNMTVPVYAEESDSSAEGTSTTESSEPPASSEPPVTEHVCSYTLTSDTATCGAAGVATYECSCGETMTKDTEPTGNHTFGAWVTQGDAKHQRVCSVCNAVDAADHTWNEGVEEPKANCQQSGKITYTCTATGCGQTKAADVPKKTTHNYGDWTITKEGHSHTCADCLLVESGKHSGKEEIIKAATCKEDGSKKVTCNACGYSETVVLTKLTTHTYDNVCDPVCNVCDATRTTEHNFTKLWSTSYSLHWHECTKCGEKKDEAKHIPGPAATEEKEQTCNVCNYIMMPKKQHVHDFEEEWTSDEAGHWHACKKCVEEEQYAAHSFENACDPDCSICGYVREDVHEYTEEWQTSDREHWNKCTLCGEATSREKHTPGPDATDLAPQLCTICGYEIAAQLDHTHDFGEKWIQAKDSHWQECRCGELSVPEPHEWDDGSKNKDKTITYTCADCGAEKTLEAPSSGFPWWIVCVLLCLVCVGGIVAIVIILKRGDFDEEEDFE